MPEDLLNIDNSDLLQRISESYNVEDLCDMMNITPEMLLDKFNDLVYNNINKFEDVLTYMDTEEME